MTDNAQDKDLSKSLEENSATRQRIADNLDNIANNLESAELKGLEYAIADIQKKSQNLRDGVFRIFVLGDVKRGKSTVINALIGEDLLPRDVNAATGILTVLRYGEEKKVTIHYRDNIPEQEVDFATFKQDYTIDIDEAKNAETTEGSLFDSIKYAVVEYPLDLLKSGIEIVDSPGLNDTEARNELSLGYVYDCQAILFVLRAVQPFTLEERRYLDNYIKDRGLSVFFLINGWDEIANELIDPEDSEELAATKEKSRTYFKTKLAEYIPESINYDERVFEISALNALRSQIKSEALTDKDFEKFATTLNNFLTTEKTQAEFNLVQKLAEQTYNKVHEIAERRISLLGETSDSLKAKIEEIEPDLKQLAELRDSLIIELEAQRDSKANAIANDFAEYILKLEDSFEVDFYRYEPDLYTADFLIPSRREEFYFAYKKAFDSFLTDKIIAWEKEAVKDLSQAFMEVLKTTKEYAKAYEKIVVSINFKLIGRNINYLDKEQNKLQYQWKNWTLGCLALASGNVAGIALAGAGFDWKSVLINWLSVFGIGRFLAIFTGMMLGPYGVLAVGLGVAGIQAASARQNFSRLIGREFSKHLPKIAEEQKQAVKEEIINSFNSYQHELIKRIDSDLKSRKTELETLIEQQSMGTEENAAIVTKLQNLDAVILNSYQQIESITNS